MQNGKLYKQYTLYTALCGSVFLFNIVDAPFDRYVSVLVELTRIEGPNMANSLPPRCLMSQSEYRQSAHSSFLKWSV